MFTAIDPADHDALAQHVGRRVELIISFGPYTRFADVTIESVVPGTGVEFRDHTDTKLLVPFGGIESLNAYPID